MDTAFHLKTTLPGVPKGPLVRTSSESKSCRACLGQCPGPPLGGLSSLTQAAQVGVGSTWAPPPTTGPLTPGDVGRGANPRPLYRLVAPCGDPRQPQLRPWQHSLLPEWLCAEGPQPGGAGGPHQVPVARHTEGCTLSLPSDPPGGPAAARSMGSPRPTAGSAPATAVGFTLDDSGSSPALLRTLGQEQAAAHGCDSPSGAGRDRTTI